MEAVYLSSHKVARLANVSPSTVLAWIDSGLLRAHRTPGGHRRVAKHELVRFLRKSGMPIPAELVPKRRLLIVDDEAPFLRTTRRLLERRVPDVEHITAEGPIDGLLQVGALKPDAVLLDGYMPGMDGVEVCRRIRAFPDTLHTTIIALTGQPSRELSRRFIEAGAAACLVKPLDVIELFGILRWDVRIEIPSA